MLQVQNIVSVYFSPTDTGKQVAILAGKTLAEQLGADWSEIDITPLHNRAQSLVFDAQTLVILAMPTYAGRVPNLIVPYLRTLQGGGACAVAVSMYGNRAYDDALQELYDILTDCDFRVVGALAMVGEHSFSTTLGAGRPNAEDCAQLVQFCMQLGTNLQTVAHAPVLQIALGQPAETRKFYKPQGPNGEFIDIRKVKPVIGNACIGCGLCVARCPLGALELQQVKAVCTGKCMKCNACMKHCPQSAIDFDDWGYLYHKTALEQTFAVANENHFFQAIMKSDA